MRAEAHVNEVRAAISQVLNAYTQLRGLVDEQTAKSYLSEFEGGPTLMGASNSDIGAADLSGAMTAIIAVLGTQMTANQRNALYRVKS
jgi:hypothetical protein